MGSQRKSVSKTLKPKPASGAEPWGFHNYKNAYMYMFLWDMLITNIALSE